MDSADFMGSSIVPGIASLGISTVSTTFPERSALGANHTGFLGSSAVPWDASLGISTVSTTFPGRNAIRVDSADFLGSSTVVGIASLRVSIVSANFLGRSVVRGATLTSWEAVLSQGGPPWELSPLAVFPGESDIRADCDGFLGSSPVLGKGGDCLGTGPSGL